MKKVFLAIILACMALACVKAGANATQDPVHKPVIAYVTDTIKGTVEFTDGDFECSPRRGAFTLTVTDTLFSYNNLVCDENGVASLYISVQINDTKELCETFAMRVHCRTEEGGQVYFTGPGSKSNAVVEWLLFHHGYVQFEIPGGPGQCLTVLIPCDNHWLGY